MDNKPGDIPPPRDMSNWRPEDKAFLSGQDERVQNFSELASLTERLNKEGFGRSITISKRPSGGAEIKEFVGYVLPADSGNIVIINDGTIAYIEPNSSYENSLRNYKDAFSPNDDSLNFYDDGISMAGVMNIIPDRYNAKVVYRNDNPGDLPNLYAKVDRSIANAQTLREEREKVREESVESVIEKFKGLFGGRQIQNKPIDEIKPPSSPSLPPQQPPDEPPPTMPVSPT